MSSMQQDFGFEKLNRVPKKIIQMAVEEAKIANPNSALNRYEICQIIAEKLEDKYLKTELEPNEPITEDRKNYNGQHILKKMGLDTTHKILRKVDFYIYRYYTN